MALVTGTTSSVLGFTIPVQEPLVKAAGVGVFQGSILTLRERDVLFSQPENTVKRLSGRRQCAEKTYDRSFSENVKSKGGPTCSAFLSYSFKELNHTES